MNSPVLDFLEPLATSKKQGGLCSSKPKIEELQNKIKFLRKQVFHDNPVWLAQTEKRLLGVSISAIAIDIYNDERITHECNQFFGSSPDEVMTFGVEILSVKEYITKSGESAGKKRADLIIADKTCKLKAKIWSDVYEKCNTLIIEGNSVIISGKPGYGKYSEFFIALNVIQP